MRVSKAIRGFIEEKVAEKYPLPPYPREAIAAEYDRLKGIRADIERKLGDLYLQMLIEAGCPLPSDIAYIRARGETFTHSRGMIGAPYVNLVEEEFNQQQHDIEQKRKHAIDNIIVTLELGGTKAELMSMLENLPD